VVTRQAILELAKQRSKQARIDLGMGVWDLEDSNSILLESTPELAAELDRRRAEDVADRTPPEDWQVPQGKLLRSEV
jgi:hypothetical protein